VRAATSGLSGAIRLVGASAVILTVVVGGLTAPLLLAAVVGAAAVLTAALRWPVPTATAFLTVGPLFLSQFSVGPVTVDNLAILFGVAVAVAWLLGRTWHLPLLVAWPLSLAVASIAAAALNHGAGAPGIVRFLSLTVLVVLLANTARSTRQIAAAWIEVAVTLGAFVCLAQPLTNYPRPYETWGEGVGLRFGGFFGHPNFAAYTISLVLLYQLYTRRFTAWRATSAVALLLALLLTGSRTALLVFALFMLPALWLRARRFFALLVPAAMALPFVGETIISRFQVIGQTGGLSGRNASGWRFEQWQDALRAARGHEWFGIGWGQTGSVLTDNLGAHSTYIEIWVELGRVGTVIAAAGLLMLVRSTRRSPVGWILIGYAALTGISDPVLVYPACISTLLVLLTGLLADSEDAGPESAAGVPAGPDSDATAEPRDACPVGAAPTTRWPRPTFAAGTRAGTSDTNSEKR
jgi:O-antigen ligase